MKNCIFINPEFIQRCFSRTLLLPGIPYNFLKIGQAPIWLNTSWWQHLYIYILSYVYTLLHIEKANSPNRWKKVKSMEMLSTVQHSLPLVENEIQVLIYHAEVYHALHNLF